MNHAHTTINFRENAVIALQDKALRQALRKAMDLFMMGRAIGVSNTPLEVWREKASEIRMRVLDDLPAYLDAFSANATKAGAAVYRAKDAHSAKDIVFHILKDRGAKRIVKSKSMVTEEIGLNEYLLSRDMNILETDLGEVHHPTGRGISFTHYCACPPQRQTTDRPTIRAEIRTPLYGRCPGSDRDGPKKAPYGIL